MQLLKLCFSHTLPGKKKEDQETVSGKQSRVSALWIGRHGFVDLVPLKAGPRSPLGSSLEPRASGLRGPLEAEAREAAVGGSHVPLAVGGKSGKHRDRREFKLVPE